MVPSFKVTLSDGIERTLKYQFLAFHELKLNPFNPRELFDFLGFRLDENGAPHIDLSAIDAVKAASWIRAGMAWEHVEGEAKHGQKMPSVEWVMSHIESPDVFISAFTEGMNAAGLVSDSKTEAKPADPQTA